MAAGRTKRTTESAEVAERELAAHEIPVTALAGVGPARAARLAVLGIESVHDLLCTAPRKLEPWPACVPIARARTAQGSAAIVVVRGTVVRFAFSRFGGRSLVRVTLRDSSGEIVALFFNQPWLRERFVKGEELELAGRVVEHKGPALAVTKLGTARAPLPRAGTLSATYPATEGVTQELLHTLCRRALDEYAPRLSDALDATVLASRGLPELVAAVREIHAPTDHAAFERARRRVALEPLLAVQASLLARRRARAAGRAFAAVISDTAQRGLLARFPFALTAGQLRIVDELRADLASNAPTRRLIQGDVGSGKTMLGVYACLVIASAGAQSAFLAPTELLAEQHFAGLAPLFERTHLRARLLTGSSAARERRTLLAELAAGSVDVVFGTHALLEPDVKFRRLALAVIDEQHRFGVAQRERLLDKGRDVHGVLMTATPIPRSLALTVYGDLDLSLLREKPPGRGAIVTRRVDALEELEAPLQAALERGERVYWVVPRIDGESDEEGRETLGAEQRFERLARKRWAAFGVELVHGRLPSHERAARLERFRSGAARLLVATTVIEVGVDVPEATAIVIEHAERLGLAQLHQLRGRVGRSSRASECFLLGKPSARERIALLESTNDGFVIAEEDLRKRGMGDLIGVRQAGLNLEGFEDGDLELVLLARDLVHAGPELAARYAVRRAPA